MKKEDLYEAINHIDDSYLQQSRRKNGLFLPLLAITTVVVIAMFLPHNEEPSPIVKSDETLIVNSSPIVIAQAKSPDMTYEKYDEWQVNETQFDAWYNAYVENMRLSKEIQPLIHLYEEAIMVHLLDENKNNVFSPLNLFMALSMLSECTASDTRQEILQVIGIEDLESLRSINRILWNANALDTPDIVSLPSSSIWLDNKRKYKTDTLNLLAEAYHSDSFAGTMGDPAYDSLLQQWLNEHTGYLLEEDTEIQSFKETNVLAIVTSMYYKAFFGAGFDPQETTEGEFHTPEGVRQVDMMHSHASRKYYRRNDFQAITMPLNYSGEILFFLPDEGLNPTDIVDDIFPVIYREADYQYIPVHAILPKLDLSASTDMIPILEELGISQAFNEADFSTVYDEPATVSEITHAARLKIDEGGIEAASYSLVNAEESEGGDKIEELEFMIDRPFVFAITGLDGSILFAGTVANP